MKRLHFFKCIEKFFSLKTFLLWFIIGKKVYRYCSPKRM
nr:MAG TPA: hypothetical protein [Caudoviricetes sp.]